MSQDETDTPRHPDSIRTLERGLSVILAFDGQHPQMTLSEVARAVGLTRAVARRFLYGLVHLGYVKTDGKWFRLTPRILQLGYSFLSGLGLPDVARPHVEDLVGAIDESVDISMLDGPDVTYVLRIPSRRLTEVSINIGKRFPAYPTASGRLLLAALPPQELDDYFASSTFLPITKYTEIDADRLRRLVTSAGEDGFAIVDQEFELGRCLMAVPIRTSEGVTAALSVSLHAEYGEATGRIDELVPPLRHTASLIEADLGRRPTPID